MNKRLFLILLPALLSATGCKQQKASETKGTPMDITPGTSNPATS